MSANHYEEDEIIEIPYPPYSEPTPECFGICSYCQGDGLEPEYHERSGKLLGYILCGNCGGDGKSNLIGTE